MQLPPLPRIAEEEELPAVIKVGLNEACQANFDSDSHSDLEDFYEHNTCVARPNMVDCGIQTSHIHFKKVANTSDFQKTQ